MQLDKMKQDACGNGGTVRKSDCKRNESGIICNLEMAKVVIGEDEEIDQMEKDIERLCLKLLLQQQPVARDLRQISAALKMITGHGTYRRSGIRYSGNTYLC